MTVSTAASDGSPKRLFEQSILTAAGSPSLAADPAALRQLVETMVQEMLTREFSAFLGAAPYARTDERRGVRGVLRQLPPWRRPYAASRCLGG
jgi:hypothetical protein